MATGKRSKIIASASDRHGAWPSRWMMDHTVARAKCHTGAHPLERRVRPHPLIHCAMVPMAKSSPSTRQMLDDTSQKVGEFSGKAGLSIGKAKARAR